MWPETSKPGGSNDIAWAVLDTRYSSREQTKWLISVNIASEPTTVTVGRKLLFGPKALKIIHAAMLLW